MLASLHKYFIWFYYDKNRRGIFNIGTSIFIWFFLTVTTPFGINNTNVELYMIPVLLMPIGISWFIISISIDKITTSISSNWEKSINKNLSIWFFKGILFIHFIFVLRGYLCNWYCLDLIEYIQLYIAVILLFGLSYLIYTFYGRYLYFHNLIAAEGPSKDSILLKSEGKESLSFLKDHIVYFKSDDNYVDIYSIDNEVIKKSTLRTSLSAIERQLTKESNFSRVHRSYIINTRFLTNYLRKSSEVEIILRDEKILIPVSKKYIELIQGIFNSPI